MSRLTRFRHPDLLAAALLLVLTVAFFWPITLAGRILAGLDVFTYFYPYRAYAAEALRGGRLPLWNPYLFLGVPFLANIQAGVLYPLNLLLAWLPAPQAISLSIAGHVFLVGLFTYLFARRALDLAPFPAVVAATVFAFSGFMGAQIEHVNQLNVSIWLPLLLLLFDCAWTRRSLIYLVLTSLVVGMQFLAGHAQAAYINMTVLGLYAVFPVGRSSDFSRQERLKPSLPTASHTQLKDLGGRLGLYGVAVALGAGLAATQLLPTLELAQLSVRAGGLPYRQAVSFSLDPRLAPMALLPTYQADVFSEYVAYLGFLPLGLALVGVVFQRGRRGHALGTFLAATGLFLALGGYNPFYWVFYHLVPGISLFRAPARWLLLYTFGAAILAGLGVEFLLRSPTDKAAALARLIAQLRTRTRRRIAWIALAAVLAALPFLRWPAPAILATWLALALLAGGLIRWGLRTAPSSGYLLALGTVVIVELFASGRALAHHRATAPQAYSSLRPAVVHLLANAGEGRILSLSDLTWDPGDLPEITQIFTSQLTPDALRDYVVATKQKEVLAPNLPLRYGLPGVDGYDGGVLPLRRWVELMGLLLPPGASVPDGRLWQQLTAIPDARWLDLLGVGYVITDKLGDVWVDGVYYDLGFTTVVGPELRLDDLSDFPATGLGLVSYLAGAASLPEGTPVAEVIVTHAGDTESRFVLRAGQDTVEGTDQDERHVTRLTWGMAGPARSIVIRYLADLGELRVRGLSLVDDRTGTSQSLMVVPGGRFRLAHTGDVKIYENRTASPRAFVVHRAQVLADDAAALVALADAAFDPRSEVLLESGAPLFGRSQGSPARIVVMQPERVVIEVDAAEPGYLVLLDSFYPGWVAQVDGQPAPIRRANVLFRAVPVPQGHHRVEMQYAPGSLALGARISLAAIFGVGLGLVLAPLSGRRWSPPTAEGEVEWSHRRER